MLQFWRIVTKLPKIRDWSNDDPADSSFFVPINKEILLFSISISRVSIYLVTIKEHHYNLM